MLYSGSVAPQKLYPRTALALLTALNLFNYIDRSLLFSVQPLVQAEFHRSDAEFGLLTSAFFLFYMVAAPFMGPLANRYSRKVIIVAGAFLWSGATLLTAFTHSFQTLLIRHTLVGIGEASFVTLGPAVVSDLFPAEKRGRVLGVYYLAIPVGLALGYLIGGYSGPRFGWRYPFYVSAIPGLLLAVGYMFMPEPVRGRFDLPQENTERETLRGLMFNPGFWTATLGIAAMTFSLGGLQVWMPTFLSRVRGYSLQSGNNIFGVIIAFDGTTASLAGGWLADRLLLRTKGAYYLVSAASMALGIPVMIVALFTTGSWMVPAILVGGFLLLLNTAPLNAAIINSVGPRIRATAIAVSIVITHLLGDSLSPWLIGFIADRHSLEGGFVSAVIAMVISSAILFYGMRFAPAIPAPSSPPRGALAG